MLSIIIKINMNQKLLLLCLFLTGFAMNAQKQNIITGKVTDKANAAPISYASIVIRESGTVVTGGITDDTGFFEIKGLEAKNYTVEVQYMGYKSFNAAADFTSGQKNISLGTIILQE